MLIPDLESPPRKKRATTYGKQSRNPLSGLNDSFDSLKAPSTPTKPQLHQSNLTSPRKSLPLFRKESKINVEDLNNFDIPSSEDEFPHAQTPGKANGFSRGTETTSTWRTSKADKGISKPHALGHAFKRKNLESTQERTLQSGLISQSGAVLDITASAKRGIGSVSRLSSSQRKHRNRNPQLSAKKLKGLKPAPEVAFRPGDSSKHGNDQVDKMISSPDLNAKGGLLSSYCSEEDSHEHSSSEKPMPREASSGEPSTASRTVSSEDQSISQSPGSEMNIRSSPQGFNVTPSQSPRGGKFSNPKGITTPRQTKLWSQLLHGEASRRNSFVDLSLESRDKSYVGKEILGATPRPQRLVDALKLSTRDSWPLDDSEGDEDTVMGAANLDGIDQEHTHPSSKSLENAEAVDHSQLSQGVAPPAAGPKFTYGGQRSYLQNVEASFEDMLSQPLDSSPGDLIMPGSGPRLSGLKVDVYDMSDDEIEKTKAIKSIHELRAAGTSGSFANEVDALLDDLQENSKLGITRQQDGLLDVARKMMDPSFRSRFIQGGYEGKLFESVSDSKDELLCATSAALVCLLLAGKITANPTEIHSSGIAAALVQTLRHGRDISDIAKSQRAKLSRVAQKALHDLRSKLLQLQLWPSSGVQNLSPMLLGLKALELLVRRLRENGEVAEPFLNKHLLSELQMVMDDTIGSAAGKRESFDSRDFKLETALSLLESCTLSAICISDSSVWNQLSIQRLGRTLDTALKLEQPTNQAVQLLALRLIVTIANHNSKHSEWLATAPLVKKILHCISHGLASNQQTIADRVHLDALVLALGAMINMVESNGSVRRIVSEYGAEQICSFVDAFVTNRAKAAEADSLAASQANVAYGYLAVLFGHLCQAPDMKFRIKSRLPNNSLRIVIETVEEFIAYHREADKADSSNEAYASFTERLRAVAETLKEHEP